jgi:hypothetical protein
MTDTNIPPWIYLTNHTVSREDLKRLNSTSDKNNDDIENKIGNLPFTLDRERVCRDEVFSDSGVLSWYDVVRQWERYIEDKKDLEHVLENQDNERLFIDNSHRFDSDYKNKQMAEFYSVEEAALDEYGKEGLTTVMLTFSASPFKNGHLINPVSHIDSLLDRKKGSWYAVKSAISRVLSGYDYEYMRILEPQTDEGKYHSSGYPHMHLALMINDPSDSLDPQDFEPVMNAHIRNCETAGSAAHKVQSDAVSINPYSEEEGGNIGSYLTSYLGKTVDSDPLEADIWFKRFLALLWGSNRRRVGFSNGANEWKNSGDSKEDKEDGQEDEENDSSDPDDWDYVGIRQEDPYGDIEVVEVESGNSGSYTSKMPDVDRINITNWWDYLDND